MTLTQLRKELPTWDWRAERDGFGWIYVGTKAFAEVTVRAFSVLSGPSDDDYSTQWRVIEGNVSDSYGMFRMRELGGKQS
jgi:hypothetical protein